MRHWPRPHSQPVSERPDTGDLFLLPSKPLLLTSLGFVTLSLLWNNSTLSKEILRFEFGRKKLAEGYKNSLHLTESLHCAQPSVFLPSCEPMIIISYLKSILTIINSWYLRQTTYSVLVQEGKSTEAFLCLSRHSWLLFDIYMKNSIHFIILFKLHGSYSIVSYRTWIQYYYYTFLITLSSFWL